MIKYIVYWTLTKLIQIPCPDKPKPDDFGRMPIVYNTCSVFHLKEAEESHHRDFMNRDSALVFMKLAGCQPDIKSVFLDSVYVQKLKKPI